MYLLWFCYHLCLNFFPHFPFLSICHRPTNRLFIQRKQNLFHGIHFFTVFAFPSTFSSSLYSLFYFFVIILLFFHILLVFLSPIFCIDFLLFVLHHSQHFDVDILHFGTETKFIFERKFQDYSILCYFGKIYACFKLIFMQDSNENVFIYIFFFLFISSSFYFFSRSFITLIIFFCLFLSLSFIFPFLFLHDFLFFCPSLFIPSYSPCSGQNFRLENSYFTV